MSNFDASWRYASSPCLAPEIAPGYFDPPAVDSKQERDVARWRKAERARLRAKCAALSVKCRQAVGASLVGHLRDLLADRFRGARGRVFSAYWPINCEPDLRGLMVELHAGGITIALPSVERKAAPLVFRRWAPGTAMVRGHWNIPVPPRDAEMLTPDIALAPLVGWDNEGYRLGYGGSYFDRMLAALARQTFTIEIGFQSGPLSSIYPQSHDVPLDEILIEAGVQSVRQRT